MTCTEPDRSRSPDLDAYACVLCRNAPCDCPPFGSAEYFTLIDERHGSR